VILTRSNSFTSMLPIQLIRLHSNHAYVQPSKCIRLYLAHGHIPTVFDTKNVRECYTNPKDTPRGVEIAMHLKNTTADDDSSMALRHLPISFIEWKVDCKASKSHKKSKRGIVYGYGQLRFYQMRINRIPQRLRFQLLLVTRNTITTT
jgi:hypothetical protein